MSRSGIATELLLAGPSALVAGEPAELHLAAVDLHSNPAVPFHETVILRVLQGDVDVARTVEFPEGQGWTTVPLTPRSEGIVQLEAVARADLLRTRSNPMEVFARAAGGSRSGGATFTRTPSTASTAWGAASSTTRGGCRGSISTP